MPDLLQARPDFVTVLESLYASEPDETRWALRLLASLGAAIRTPMGVGIGALAHEDDLARPRFVMGLSTVPNHFEVTERETGFRGRLEALDPDGVRTMFYPANPVASHLAFERSLPESQRGTVRAYRQAIDAHDVLGLFAFPMQGLAAFVYVPQPREVVTTPAERRALTRLVGHLDGALRLRLRPEATVAAVVSPDGALLDGASLGLDTAGREGLAARIAAVERSRLRAERARPEALDHWRGLLAGRYSVVPHEDQDGRRAYLLVDNAPLLHPHARLTPREVEVVHLAARGLGGKETAYSLGRSPASVSAALASAAARLGLPSRAALVEVASAVFGVRGAALDTTRLTAAEREVLALLRRGMSNDEIARLRARSPRTIANQVAAILQKSGAASRRAVMGRPGGHG